MIRTALKFGAFTALCLVSTLYLTSIIGNLSFDDSYKLTATFDDVNGLLINDNVKVAGVVVGKVTNVQVREGQAYVTFNMKDDVRVPEDSTASIRWRNLIGQRYLYVNTGDAATTLAPDSHIDDTESVVDIGELFNRVGPLIAAVDPEKVNDFLETIVEALEGNEDKVGQALDDLAVVARGLGERDATIGSLIQNLNTVAGTLADRDAQIRTMLDNLVQLSEYFGQNTALLEEAMVELGAFSEDFSFLLENNRAELDRLLTNLHLIVQVIEPRLGTLERALDISDDFSRSTFNAARYGEFLNQAIYCFSTGPPPCPFPLVTNVTGVTSGSAAVTSLLSNQP